MTIDSVMELPDNAPLPKGAQLDGAFSRSIVVTTPARTLKFTAVTHERHELWMTALAFLAQSGSLPAPLPPGPVPIQPASARNGRLESRAPSTPPNGAIAQDSVRLTKEGHANFQQAGLSRHASVNANTRTERLTAVDEGADFPAIPRLYVGTSRHQRKRSNSMPTGAPTLLQSFRSFTANAKTQQPTSDQGDSQQRRTYASAGARRTRRASIANTKPVNLPQESGTVCLEAFVDPTIDALGVVHVPAPPTRRHRSGSITTADKRRAGLVSEDHGHDPFAEF